MNLGYWEKNKNTFWVKCPICGGKTRIKVYENTALINFPLYCPKCKREINVDIVQLRIMVK